MLKNIIAGTLNKRGLSLVNTADFQNAIKSFESTIESLKKELESEREKNQKVKIEKNNRESRQKVQKNSLLQYYSNIYSQRGDDGIIAEIFRRLKINKGFFVEFGAWDGFYLSNCRLLFENGWGGLFIEADKEKFQDLKEEYKNYPDVICVKEMVSPDGKDGKKLDRILSEHKIKQTDLDFVSIDVDGLDLNIFESMEKLPKVVCIEGGFSWHPNFKKRVPDEVAAENLQQPLTANIESVIRKGYVPVCFNQNLYAVKKEYSEHFADIKNSPEDLYLDAFYFFSEDFRNHLVALRKTNNLIKETEGEYKEIAPGY